MNPSQQTKVKSLSNLLPILNKAKKLKKKIVFTNGCFDILHVGHVRYLAQAKSLGDLLIVGLNTDASVQKLKGPDRPINKENDRAEVLAALGCVDYVVLFGEDTPEKLIHSLSPDVLVKGGDWKKKDIVGSDFVEAQGGKVLSLPFVEGFSTTNVLKKAGKLRAKA